MDSSFYSFFAALVVGSWSPWSSLLLGTGGLIGFNTKWYPDISGGFCLTLLLPWIMFRSGVMVDMKQLVSNYKSIIFRGMLDNFVTLACISLGTYYLLPITGIQSLRFTDHLIIGAVFLPSNFVFNFPAAPFPFIELIDDHSIVLGESALGIALSVMLLKHVKSLDVLQLTINPRLLLQLCGYLPYMLVASSMLGLLIGWLLSLCRFVAKVLVFKFFNSGKHFAFRGATFALFVPAYLSYILAERLNLSGTLCVFFYGVAAANYILPEDPEGKAYWRDDIHFIFIFLKWILHVWVGASGVTETMNQWKSGKNRVVVVFAVSTVLLVTHIFGKLLSVYPLSCCHAGQKEIQKLEMDPVFYDLWRLGTRGTYARWKYAKAVTAKHKWISPSFSRWGLSKLETQVMVLGTARNAETYLQVSALGSVLLPSMLSYVFAYDQFIKSDNNGLVLVYSCTIVVYFCTSVVFSEFTRRIEMRFIEYIPQKLRAQKKKQ